jgi:hypothetical protein
MMKYVRIESNVVTNIEVADEEWVAAQPDPSLYVPYNDENPAMIGGGYENGIFYAVQPWPSWELNRETYKWEPPVPFPAEPGEYFWNEESLTWIKVERP